MGSDSDRVLTLEYDFAGARITLYDALDRTVFETFGPGRETLTLKMGLYVVRVEGAGSFREDLIRHDGTLGRYAVERPQLAAAAPVRSSSLRHEYYEEPLRNLGAQTNHGAVGDPPHNGRLVIMVRALADGSNTVSDLGASLRVTGLKRSLGEETVLQREGWRALSADAAAGRYELVVLSPVPRCLPIHIYPGWTTFVFLLDDRWVRVEDATVLMARLGESLDPNDDDVNRTISALAALQNERLVRHGELDEYLLAKFANPMLGLIGGHLLVRLFPTSPLITDVLRNLTRLVGGGPDVDGLRVAHHAALGLPPPKVALVEPPIVRLGFRALVQTGGGEFVPERSRLERIAMRAYADSPWTTWRPEPWWHFVTSPIDRVRSVVPDDLVDRNRGLRRAAEGGRGPALDPKLVEELLRDAAEPLRLSDPDVSRNAHASDLEDWVMQAVTDIESSATRAGTSLEPRAVAARLDLPVATVERALRGLGF
jgi:hypothetical protein